VNVLLVALGSAAGGVARWLLGSWVQRLSGGAPPAVFPVGTLVVNASGSFLIGLLVVPFRDRAPHWYVLLGVGFCGGYTTFSTFSLDTVALLETRGWLVATANVMSSVAAGLAGVAAGLALGRAAMGRLG